MFVLVRRFMGSRGRGGGLVRMPDLGAMIVLMLVSMVVRRTAHHRHDDDAQQQPEDLGCGFLGAQALLQLGNQVG